MNSGVGAEVAAEASGAVVAAPYGVEVFHRGCYECGIIGEYAGFKVSLARTFHSHSGSGEVGGTYVGPLSVDDDYFEVNTWT